MHNPANPLGDDRLTPQAAELLQAIRSGGFPGWSLMEIEVARAAIVQMKVFAGPQDPVAFVAPVEILRADGTRLRAALYKPHSAEPLPALVYMHGGGWVIGSHTSVDELVRTLVNRSKCAILAIDYRLAPEHKYPAALEDVLLAASWLETNGSRYGIDSKRLGAWWRQFGSEPRSSRVAVSSRPRRPHHPISTSGVSGARCEL